MATAAAFPVRPVLGRVILRIEKTGEKVSASGIVTSLDSSQGAKKRDGLDRVGVVVAFDEAFYSSPRNAPHRDGLGAYRGEMTRPDIEIGDRVFFQVSWAGEPFVFEGVDYHVLEGEDAAALVPEGVSVEPATR